MTAVVLPFTSSLKWFGYILTILVIALVVTLVVLFNWCSFTKLIVGLYEYVRKPAAKGNEQPARDGFRNLLSSWLMILNQKPFPWRLRMSNIRIQKDLEGGAIELADQCGLGQH